MMTIIATGLKITAGGCRYRANNGKLRNKRCHLCLARGNTCELEPYARRLAELAASRRRRKGVVASRAEYSVSID